MTAPRPDATAVLFSGGLDSAVLLADAIARAANGPDFPAPVAGSKSAEPAPVTPIYVSAGLAWEPGERAAAERLLGSSAFAGRVRPLVALAVDMHDVYPATHWAIRGTAPRYDTPDSDVYIEGRNIVLLSKAAVYMAHAKIGRILIGPLAGNPFPDATPAFFDAMSRALSIGLAAPLTIEAPLLSLHKADVIRLGRSLGVPLELTLSCMQPRGAAHCGACSKCRERIDAFREAGGGDPTAYAVQGRRGGERLDGSERAEAD
ncbi:MAG: 7-cyano-7-deazaguanine synthase [Acidobacteriota bacterium]